MSTTTAPVDTCRRGHELTDTNVYEVRENGRTKHRCRACHAENRIASRRRVAARKATAETRPRASVNLSFVGGAQCGGADLNRFFNTDGEHGIPERAQEAAYRFCAACPVRAACQQTALDGDEIGLWGGNWHSRDTARAHKSTPLIAVETAEVAA